MKSLLLSILFLGLIGAIAAQDLTVSNLTVEHKKNPVGIDAAQPRFSWKISGAGFNIMQTAYSIRVSSAEKFGSSSMIWQSGKVQSEESVLLDYKGPALKSGQKCYWQVKVWDNKGHESKWSETASWEMGLLSSSEWKAKWIEIASDTSQTMPAPHFRKEFSTEKNSLILTSPAIPNAPRFRFTYLKQTDDSMLTRFEMTPPGQPDVFKVYLEGPVTKK